MIFKILFVIVLFHYKFNLISNSNEILIGKFKTHKSDKLYSKIATKSQSYFRSLDTEIRFVNSMTIKL